MKIVNSIYLGIGVTLMLSACGAGSGEGLDVNGDPIISTQPTQAQNEIVELNFKSIQQSVFTPICAECHFGANPPQGLRLDEETVSYALLVNVSSSEDSGRYRVEPGDPDNSYLIQKLEGTALISTRMPLNQPPLPEATIAAIRQWISDGALP